MMRSLRHRLLSVFVLTIFLVTVLTPDKVSAHLFESGSWIGSSLYAKSMTNMAGIFSQGIGGLEVNIDSARDLSVSNLSYNNGHLHANIGNKPVKVKVRPEIVQEAIRVMEHTDKQKKFQVSFDSTAVGKIPYTDEVLENTTIGQSLLDADSDFASVVFGSQSLPNNQIMHPYEKGLYLLDNHADYSKLPDTWISPPSTLSQIYLYFKPMESELVQLEFNPQIFFLSASGHPVEVSEEEEKLGELPYEPLKEDVKNNPQDYIKAVPALEDAASITATLGLVAAGCQKPASCLNLKREAWISSIMSYFESKKKTEDDANQLKIEQVQEAIKKVQKAQSEFMDKWVERSFQNSLRNFHPGDNSDITWAKAYDAVQIGIKNLSTEDLIDSILPYIRVSFTPEELKKVTEGISKKMEEINTRREGAEKLAKPQFLNNSVPQNNSLLMAASAITFAWDGDIKHAKKRLYRAIEQSTNNPGTYFQVAKMGRSVGQIIKKENKSISMGEEIELRMKFEQRKAKVKAYDEIDHCLKDYEKKNLLNCIPKDISRKDKQTKDLKTYELRMLETYARDSGLYEYVPRRDLAWLHGRFAYLIGNEINDLTQKKDRLRFLSAYTQKAQPGWHSWKLRQLENKMRISLGMKPHPTDWRSLISGVAIGVAILDIVQQSLKKRRA